MTETDIIESFVANWDNCSKNSYNRFLKFGGPSVYFHNECLRECKTGFLSKRHIELVYATLTSWGMHRMGNAYGKLTKWDDFSGSILQHKKFFENLRSENIADLTNETYSALLRELKDAYIGLKISCSNQTIVAHSKAIFHILPNLIPPIDRRYTMKFFQLSDKYWLDSSNSRRRRINAQSLQNLNVDQQFDMFCGICAQIKNIGDNLSWRRGSSCPPHVLPLKEIDNAIIEFLDSNSFMIKNAA